MKQIRKPRGVKDGREYFLRRHGGWFRPEAHGYTDDVSHAGVYSARDARSYMQAEGVTAVAVAAMKSEIFREMDNAIVRASKLSALYQRARMTTAPITNGDTQHEAIETWNKEVEGYCIPAAGQ